MLGSKVVVKAVLVCALAGFFLLATRSARTAGVIQDQPEPSPAGIEFFEKKIRPVLTESCYGCHSAQAKKVQGGLLLDSRAGLLKGGASGQPAVMPGAPEQSLLIRAIRYTDPKLQMPYGTKLSDQVIKDFEEWVKMGAPDPRKAEPAAASRAPYDFAEAKKFWAFQPVREVQLPAVRNVGWVSTAVDRFVLAELEKRGLKPVADADRMTLIRRATFDLTGLPPTPEEIDSFLRDKSPDAYARLIDRLLASPAYGEKWGRHWLDVARYADTAGCNSDYPVPAAYRYRNYVIDSFNRDKPYDQFIREQIAGDLLPARTEAERFEQIIATGYIAMSRRFGSRNAEFNLTIDDTIDNLGKAFLGLSVGCARCHDHKFDPLPQRDYYALYGIFNSSRYSFPGQEIYKHPAEMVALASGKKAEDFYRIQRELSELDDKVERLTTEKGVAARNKGIKEKQAKTAAKPADKTAEAKDAKDGNNRTNDKQAGNQAENSGAKPEAVKIEAKLAGKTITGNDLLPADYDRDSENHKVVQSSQRMPEEVDAEMLRVKARIAELGFRTPQVEKAYAVVDSLAHNAHVHRKGDPKNPGDEVPRGFLTVLGGQVVPAGYKGSGRDLLANWIADAQNPLTARVMVNRIWQWHFGKGLVQTVSDFGARGKAPTHPELLDYLATQFIKQGWSIKAMHRMLMLSHTYRMSGTANAQNAAIDVNNDYLWRFDRRRLEAEEVRDAMLFVSGALDRSVGGEHPFPPEKEWRYTQHEQFFAVYDTNRRSVYLMQQRIRKHPFFEVFDGADQNAITGVRPLSTTPLQALYLMNSPFMHQQADNLAVRVGLAYDTLPERLDFAFRLTFGRTAKPDEIKEATAYLKQVKQELQNVNTPDERLTRAALASYLRVVLSSNEFLYVD